MPKIDYYLSTLSPYVYLSGTRFEALAQKHGVQVTYKPLDILALFPRTGGQVPKERHPSRLAYRAQELPRQARKNKAKLNLKPAYWPTNPLPSSCAIIAAQKAGGGDLGALVHGLTRAVWAEDRNIAEDDVIRDCLSRAGFDPALLNSALVEGVETYERNLEEAVAAGVFGAPFYVVDDGALFWGQDRIEDLDLHLSGDL